MPTMHDCERRAFGKRFIEDLMDLGLVPYKEKSESSIESIAQRIGKSVHSTVEAGLRAKQEGRVVDTDTLQAVALDVLHKGDDPDEARQIELVVDFDIKGITSVEEAEKAVKKLVVPCAEVISKCDPLEIEPEIVVAPDWLPNWTLRIHPDFITTNHDLHDVKTVKTLNMIPSYHAQLGTYAAGYMATGMEIRRLVVDAIQKPGKTTDCPPAMQIEYPLQASVDLAVDILREFTEKADTFFGEGITEPRLFRANPQSNLCSKRFCPLFGTKACEVTVGA